MHFPTDSIAVAAAREYIRETLTNADLERDDATLALNGIGLVLLVFPLVQLGMYGLRSEMQQRELHNLPAEMEARAAQQGQTLPDVYYIIVDAYARDDVLKSVFNYDNSVFSDWLQQKCFYLASCSQSNYARTDFSLASSLNLSYVPDLNPKFTPDFRDPYPIWRLLQHSAVRTAFENAGYKTVAFATGFAWSQLEDADVYLEPPLILAPQ